MKRHIHGTWARFPSHALDAVQCDGRCRLCLRRRSTHCSVDGTNRERTTNDRYSRHATETEIDASAPLDIAPFLHLLSKRASRRRGTGTFLGGKIASSFEPRRRLFPSRPLPSILTFRHASHMDRLHRRIVWFHPCFHNRCHPTMGVAWSRHHHSHPTDRPRGGASTGTVGQPEECRPRSG